MLKRNLIIGISLAWTLFCFHGTGYTFNVDTLKNPSKAGGWVTVDGNYLDSNEIEELNRKISQINEQTAVEIAVVIVPHTNGNISGAAQAIFNKWGIGNKDVNNGLLLIASMEERLFRTHTGYGMEKVFSDDNCRFLQDNIVVPAFKQGRYKEGIYNYLKVIHEVLMDDDIALAMTEKVKKYSRPSKISAVDKDMGNILIFLIVVLTIPGLILSFTTWKKTKEKMNQEYKWYSQIREIIKYGVAHGTIIGCYILFGLALFFSYHAVRIFFAFNGFILLVPVIPLAGLIFCIVINVKAFIKKKEIIQRWRTEPRQCPECSHVMRKLSELEEDEHLNMHQQVEERLKTVDYDVWVCSHCENKTIESFHRFRAFFYIRCVQCGSLASKKSGSYIVDYPTYTSSGSKKITFTCLACRHQTFKYVTIPRKVRSSYRSSSSGFGSSSGGGSSFGGGSSGGGGATSSW